MEPWVSLLIVLAVIAVGWWFLKKIVKIGFLLAIAAALLIGWWWFAIGSAEAFIGL